MHVKTRSSLHSILT